MPDTARTQNSSTRPAHDPAAALSSSPHYRCAVPPRARQLTLLHATGTCTSVRLCMLDFLRPELCTPVPGDTAVNRTRGHGMLHCQNNFCILGCEGRDAHRCFQTSVITGRVLSSLQFRLLDEICMVDISHNCYQSHWTVCCSCPRAQSREHTSRNSLTFPNFDADVWYFE